MMLDDGHWSDMASSVILSPYSLKRAFWEVFGVTLLAWDMFYIPFSTFQTPEHPWENRFVNSVEVVALFYWAVDVIASFMVGFYRNDGMVEMKPKRIARNYIRK